MEPVLYAPQPKLCQAAQGRRITEHSSTLRRSEVLKSKKSNNKPSPIIVIIIIIVCVADQSMIL
jgi:hypothetical protein